MAQVTIYLPDKLAARLRRDAKQAGKSLSSYIAELATPPQLKKKTDSQWRREIMKFAGICADAPIEVPDDPPPNEDDVPSFD